jgi:hypothetical protein
MGKQPGTAGLSGRHPLRNIGIILAVTSRPMMAAMG